MHNLDVERRAHAARRRSRGTLLRVAIDVVMTGLMFVVFVTSGGPDFTAHTIASLCLIIPVAQHLYVNRTLLLATRIRWKRQSQRLRLKSNVLVGLLLALALLTGLLTWTGLTVARPLHAASGQLALVAVVAHVVVQRRRLGAFLRRPRARQPVTPGAAALVRQSTERSEFTKRDLISTGAAGEGT